jgi:hypothetical protein
MMAECKQLIVLLNHTMHKEQSTSGRDQGSTVYRTINTKTMPHVYLTPTHNAFGRVVNLELVPFMPSAGAGPGS